MVASKAHDFLVPNYKLGCNREQVKRELILLKILNHLELLKHDYPLIKLKLKKEVQGKKYEI